jgi:hypothetical protein
MPYFFQMLMNGDAPLDHTADSEAFQGSLWGSHVRLEDIVQKSNQA